MTRQASGVAVLAIVCAGLLAALMASYFLTPISNDSTPTSTSSTGYVYLLSGVGGCKGPAGYAPCFGGNITQAEVFNCLTAATTPSGCAQTVVNPSNASINYQITVWYPSLSQNNEPPWANCRYHSTGDPAQQSFARCVTTNSTAFVVTEPAPPPL